MHRAAAGTENSVVVVEGFFDSMKVHQAGVRSVVGLMGRLSNEPQRHLLMERFRHVTLMLDGDPAGRKASAIIAETLRRHCEVCVVLLPDGVQPVGGGGYRKGPAVAQPTTISTSVTSLNEATRGEI
jgi:DNA primase